MPALAFRLYPDNETNAIEFAHVISGTWAHRKAACRGYACFLFADPQIPLNGIFKMAKVVEYMTLGKPIVSFDLKGARYSGGDRPFYMSSNDAVAFADSILELLGKTWLVQRRWGETGMASVQASLSRWKQSESMLRPYRFVTSELR